MNRQSRQTRQRRALNDLRARHAQLRTAIHSRLQDFARVPSSEYFYELAYCMMTPQTSAENAEYVVASLKSRNFMLHDVDPVPLLADRSHYIRFHKTKSKHLLELKQQFPLVAAALSNGMTPHDVREWLVKSVKGLGYKEATHFLRNIGRNDGLAILDRHILRNLKRYGVIRSIPQSLSRKKYLAIEARFQRFAERIGIPLDELDLLFWSMETGEIRK